MANLRRARIQIDPGRCTRFYMPDDGNTVVIPIPAAPIMDPFTGTTEDETNANWQASLYATGYYIDISEDPTFSSFFIQNLDVGNVLTYNITGLNYNTIYYGRIRAYNISGTSVDSDIESTTTLPADPSIIFGDANLYGWYNSQNVVLTGSDIDSFVDLSVKNNNLSFVTTKAQLNGEVVNGYTSANFNASLDQYQKLVATLPTSGNAYILLKTADTVARFLQGNASNVFVGRWDSTTNTTNNNSGTLSPYVNNTIVSPADRVTLRNLVAVNAWLLLATKGLSYTNYSAILSLFGADDFSGNVLEIIITDGATAQQDLDLIAWLNYKYNLSI